MENVKKYRKVETWVGKYYRPIYGKKGLHKTFKTASAAQAYAEKFAARYASLIAAKAKGSQKGSQKADSQEREKEGKT